MRVHQPGSIIARRTASDVDDWSWNTTRRRLGVLWRLTKPYRFRTFLSVFSLLAATATALAPPLLAKYALDDATASVDATTEARIKLALREVMKGRTTLIIAHRLSTISLAGHVVVLDGGRIVAQGSHAELTESSPVYREIHAHGLVDRTFVDMDGDAPVAERRAAGGGRGRLP